MAFVPWKDRVTATPHRYKLTEVSTDTYDLEAVPGAVSEAGTPVNATNLDRLIQRDGDDIKDTVVAFTEAGARANISTGESTATLFGKIKKYFTDLKAHSFVAPSNTQGTGTTTVPCDNLLTQSSFARVIRAVTELGLTYPCTTTDILNALFTGAYVNTIVIIGLSTAASASITDLPDNYGTLLIHLGSERLRWGAEWHGNKTGIGVDRLYVGKISRSANTVIGVAWSEVMDSSSYQKISAIKEYSVSPLVPTTPSGPSAAVAKAYADSLRTVYDKVIRTQAEFETLIADATWLGATSVALVGQFTLSEANNSGIKIPATVKQIHGFNGAKITVTNFLYNSSTAKGGLWYAIAPTTQDYSIRDLEVSLTGTGSLIHAFYNCIGLYNCTGTGTGGTDGSGFRKCTNLTNCTGTGTGGSGGGYGFIDCNYITNCTGTGEGTTGYGFGFCTNLSNCTGTGTGGTFGCGFYDCDNLSNCTGKGEDSGDASEGFGFYGITRASNCQDGGSSTNMWGGTNTNIDVDTCCKTPVTASNTTLNT